MFVCGVLLRRGPNQVYIEPCGIYAQFLISNYICECVWYLTIYSSIDLVVCTTVDAFVNLCKGHKYYAEDGSDVAYKTAECWTS